MNINHLFSRVIIALSLSSITIFSHANDVEISNNTVNYILWFAVVLGVASGFGMYHWLFKNFKTYETLKSWAVAVVVAMVIASLPLWFIGDFAKVCMQTITDSNGYVREVVTAADQCVLSREEVSALWIDKLIAGFKSALGYNDSFLSTGLVYFFYYFAVFFWTSVIYLIALFTWKKWKS